MLNNLSTFAEIVKKSNEENRLREAAEAERKAKEVAPLLSELFSTISAGKKVSKETKKMEAPLLDELQAALLNPEKFKTESKAKKDKVIELVAELEEKVAEIQTKLDEPSTTNKEVGGVTDLEKNFLKLFNKLQNDFQSLKKYVDHKHSMGGGGFTAGSGEVRILRMDDVVRGALPVDGSVMTWDAYIGKFKFVLPLNNGTTITDEEMPYAKRIDFISDDVLYKGEAAVGSLESSPVWRIRKIIIGVDSDVSETWANGTSTYDKIWADRLTLTYS